MTKHRVANKYFCDCSKFYTDPDLAIAHIRECDGPLYVSGPEGAPKLKGPVPKYPPGTTIVFEGATIHLDGRTGIVGFPPNSDAP